MSINQTKSMTQKKWLIVFALAYFPLFIYGQKKNTIQWEQTFGFEKNDGAHSIISTIDKGFAIIGYTTDISFNIDLWIIKLNAKGEKEWSKKYGTPKGIERGVDILQKTNGDFLVLGNTNAKGAGAMDLWLLRLDHKGNLLEEKVFGKAANDWASQIITCRNGGYAIAGTTNSTQTENSSMWLLKLNNSLELEWENTFGGDQFPSKPYRTVSGETKFFPSREEANTLTQTNDLGFALGGYISDQIEITNAWVVKTDSLGQASWNTSYGTVGGDVVKEIYESQNKIVAVGIRYDKKDNYNYMMDFAFVEEEKIIEKTFNAEDYETVEASCQTQDGGFVLLGFKGELPSRAYRENREPHLDIWMVKISSKGEKEWEHTFSQKATHQLKGIIETEENTLVITGAKRDESTQLQDLWVIKLKIEN